MTTQSISGESGIHHFYQHHLYQTEASDGSKNDGALAEGSTVQPPGDGLWARKSAMTPTGLHRLIPKQLCCPSPDFAHLFSISFGLIALLGVREAERNPGQAKGEVVSRELTRSRRGHPRLDGESLDFYRSNLKGHLVLFYFN